jgi:hypothetical protein|tara:strand:+ start:291 stop:761 length:471 start_codon:yes stop_codon:yes gene_type:complete
MNPEEFMEQYAQLVAENKSLKAQVDNFESTNRAPSQEELVEYLSQGSDKIAYYSDLEYVLTTRLKNYTNASNNYATEETLAAFKEIILPILSHLAFDKVHTANMIKLAVKDAMRQKKNNDWQAARVEKKLSHAQQREAAKIEAADRKIQDDIDGGW